MTEQVVLGRYRLLALVSERPDGVALWHGYDDVLDRAVSIRVVPLTHPRTMALLESARRAATVDDRRLLRILDLIEVPLPEQPGQYATGVVSEWANGRHLGELLALRAGTPLGTPEALDLVAEVGRAVAAGAAHGVGHGRLRPTSVFVTDAGEVRVRGLGVDAALLGTGPLSNGEPAPSVAAADVDGLASLAYLLCTGYWPGTLPESGSNPTPPGPTVLPPSQVRAAVPRSVDLLMSRSLSAAPPQRSAEPITTAAGFAAAAGAALDHVAPVTTATLKPVTVGPMSPRRRLLRGGGRVLAVAAGLGIVAAFVWVGLQLLSADSPTAATDEAATTEILTSPAVPVDELTVTGLEQALEILGFRSFDPYGDDDGNDKPDRRKGRENDDLTATVNDADPGTAWLTSEYGTADLDGKGGVGLIVDLGKDRDVQQVTVNLVGRGTGVDVRVSDTIKRDPALWSPLGEAFAPQDRVEIRSPRPVTGRYVLIWLTQLPPVVGTEEFQGGVRSVVVTG
jgi:hypothetical protein